MDMSKDLSLINSSNESSSDRQNEEYSSANVKIIMSDLQAQLVFKNQNIAEFESNICRQSEKITSLENSTHELQSKLDTFKQKLANVEKENFLLKITIDTLNSTIISQKDSLDISPKDMQDTEEIQNKSTDKECITSISLNDNLIDTMLANGESFFANNDNIKNIIYSFKSVLEKRNQEIKDLKETNIVNLKQDLEIKTKCLENLNVEINDLQEQGKANIATINKLLRENNNLISLEKDLTRELDTARNLNSELKMTNNKNLENFAALKENNEVLLLQITNNQTEQQKVICLNDQLNKKIIDLTEQITNLVKDLQQKDDIISKLKTEDATALEHLNKANVALNKLRNVIKMLTGDIEDVPGVIDNFVNVFNVLCNSLNALEDSASNIMSQKEQNHKDLLELQNRYDEMCNMYEEKTKDLFIEIDKLKESEQSLTILNENLSQQLRDLGKEVESNKIYIKTLTDENSTLQMQLSSLRYENLNLNNNLSSKENALKENEATLRNTMEKQISHTEKYNMERDVQHLKATLESKEKLFEKMLQIKEDNISELSFNLKLLENNVTDKCCEIFSLHEKHNKVVNDRDSALKIIFEKVCLLANNINMANSSSVEFKDNDMTKIIELIFDKITNCIVNSTNRNSTQRNYDEILFEMQEQLRKVNMQNVNLVNKLDLIEEVNLKLINTIQTIQRDNADINGDFTTGNTLLEHLQHELKLKHDELSQMVDKVTDWKDQFVTLDITMKKHMNELKLENENLKLRCVDLKNDTEENIKHLNERSFEEYSPKTHLKVKEDIITTKYSPKSLLTLCCSTIIDFIQPRDIESENSTTSNTDTEISRVATAEKKCECDHLSKKLNIVQNEKLELTNTINQLKLANYKLKNELEDVRIEVQLLLEPAFELQKKIIGHRTNLSILTATTYAENKSLISQVKGLQHHHNRFHNVCLRDIPAFKRQLCELLSILKDSTLTPAEQNVNLKRYSLPDVFDNNNTLRNLRNDSTLDGDLLMLDTNVSLTTADNTLVACDQTCLDLTQTLYSEVSCQTNEVNMTGELKSQMELLSNDNKNMNDLLQKFKEENTKLREQIDVFSEEERTRTEIVNRIKKETIEFSNVCEKCKELDELKIKFTNIQSEYKDLSEQISEVKEQKVVIEQKYNDLKLEIPETDAIVKKVNNLERDCNTKDNEIIKLTNKLSSKNKELQLLQEENISLSTQVMENISETDDLNKELNDMRQKNVELTEKCNKLEEEKYKYDEAKCTECDLKDNIISKLQANCVSSLPLKQKLNRSYSDSDTSSRYNKICTLQSELTAGREDCKELTEDFTTIKHHLERSNISMDLDESTGDSTINSHSVDCLSKSPQGNTCIMPDIPEERPLDDYIVEKMECINYYVEKTGIKSDLNSNVKIIEVMKMFYDNLIAKHGDEVENLSNKLRDYEKCYRELQIKMSNINCENEKITVELHEKKTFSEKLTHVISQLKNNIIIVSEETEKLNEADKNERVVNLFKEKLLKMIDTEFGLSSLDLFSFIDNIIMTNAHALNEALQDYNKLQENMLQMKSELVSAYDDATKLKKQLNDKESEYNLLKAHKDKIQEISKAVTLDIVNREQTLNASVSKHFQKLVELDIIDSEALDTQLHVKDKVDVLLEHLIALLTNKPKDNEYRDKLSQEILHLKHTIHCKDKLIDELKARNGELLETIENTKVSLIEETNKSEELNKAYNSQVEENHKNSSLIAKLTDEIEILNRNVDHREATVISLSEKEDTIRNLVNKINEHLEDISRLKSANEFINKEKNAYAIELEESSKTIKQNNTELNRMTSDILVLRNSIKENTTIIETLKDEAKLLLKQNLELKEQFEEKCQDCARLETNIKTHEKTAEIQNRIIIRYTFLF